jgi:hypothetical protein
LLSAALQRDALGGKFLDLPCLPHIMALIAGKYELPHATSFVQTLSGLMSFSDNAQNLWKQHAGSSYRSYSRTRWLSLFDTAAYLLQNFDKIIPFLDECIERQYGMSLMIAETI